LPALAPPVAEIIPELRSSATLAPLPVLTSWLRVDERGFFGGIFKVLSRATRTLAMLLISSLASLSWEYTFFGPALLLAVLGLACVPLMKERPSDCGFADFETHDTLASPDWSSIRMIYGSLTPWLIALCVLCMSVVNSNIENWFPRYYSTMFNLPASKLQLSPGYALYMAGSGLAGGLGLLVAGSASDRLVKYGRVLFLGILTIGQFLGLIALRLCIRDALMASMAAVAIVFFAQSGLMLAMITFGMDLGRGKAVATAIGFFLFASFVGSTLSGFCLGRILDHARDPAVRGAEFAVWPLSALPFAGLAVLLCVFLWLRRRKVQPE
jgi:sugar phosphate permease